MNEMMQKYTLLYCGALFMVFFLYPVRTMWTTLPPELRDGLVLDVGV